MKALQVQRDIAEFLDEWTEIYLKVEPDRDVGLGLREDYMETVGRIEPATVLLDISQTDWDIPRKPSGQFDRQDDRGTLPCDWSGSLLNVSIRDGRMLALYYIHDSVESAPSLREAERMASSTGPAA